MWRFTLYLLFSLWIPHTLFAACTPVGTAGDDTVTCIGVINSFQYLYGGNDRITLNAVSDISDNNSYWLDEALGGNPATDGNDTFISHNSRFNGVFGFSGDDIFEIYNSQFNNIFGDTSLGHGVSQRGDDTIYIENSHSTGWILGGNDNDHITIKDSNVSFVAAGYSDIYGAIEYTPYDGNDTIILDHVSFTAVNYYYATRPGAVEGGKADDTIAFIHGGEAFNATGGHGNDLITLDGGVHFAPCSFTNDIGNVVDCGIYGDEPYLSEFNISAISLTHGDDEILIRDADVSGTVVHGGHGSDRVVIDTPSIITATAIDGGDDRGIADSYVDSLYFDQWSGEINGSDLPNWEQIVFDNASMISFGDSNLSTGYESGIDPNTSLPYGLVIQHGSTWTQHHDFDLDGNLHNDAVIDMQDGDLPGSVLTVENNYTANQGVLYLDAVLDDALPSQSDRLLVKGDTAGTTILSVDNVGGVGAQTPVGDNVGILVVEVEGASHGVFALDHMIEVGDYFYHLLKGSNGNWYLQSEEKNPAFSLSKEANLTTISSPETIGYIIELNNTGNVPLTDITLSDIMPNGTIVTPALQSGDIDQNEILDLGEHWIYAISYVVTQAEIDAGDILSNRVDVSTAEGLSANDTAQTEVIWLAPHAENDSIYIEEAGSARGYVGENDFLGTCRPAEAQWVMLEGPKHGEIVFEEDGHFSYTPEQNYHGEDFFTYTMVFPMDCPASNTAVVSLDINIPCYCDDVTSDGGNSVNLYSIIGFIFGLLLLIRRKEINSF